jgi:hypothetical protein
VRRADMSSAMVASDFTSEVTADTRSGLTGPVMECVPCRARRIAVRTQRSDGPSWRTNRDARFMIRRLRRWE